MEGKMKGFKITCLKCGNETVFAERFDTDNDIISVYASRYDGEIEILCDCCENVIDND